MFIFYDNASATGKRIWPCLGNLIKTLDVTRHRIQGRAFAEKFCKSRTLMLFIIRQQDTAMVGSTNGADILNNFLERLSNILRPAQLDACLENIGSGICRKVRHRRRIRLRRYIVAINAVTDIFLV